MSLTSSLEAICVIETSSIARGFVVLDALVKRAPVVVKTARAVSPGKFLLVFGGAVIHWFYHLRSAAGRDVLLFDRFAHDQ